MTNNNSPPAEALILLVQTEGITLCLHQKLNCSQALPHLKIIGEKIAKNILHQKPVFGEGILSGNNISFFNQQN
jgi:hypothetical protein